MMRVRVAAEVTADTEWFLPIGTVAGRRHLQDKPLRAGSRACDLQVPQGLHSAGPRLANALRSHLKISDAFQTRTLHFHSYSPKLCSAQF